MQLQNPIPRIKKLVTNIITYGKRARFHTEQALLKIQPLAWNSMVYIRQTTPRSKGYAQLIHPMSGEVGISCCATPPLEGD